MNIALMYNLVSEFQTDGFWRDKPLKKINGVSSVIEYSALPVYVTCPRQNHVTCMSKKNKITIDLT